MDKQHAGPKRARETFFNQPDDLSRRRLRQQGEQPADKDGGARRDRTDDLLNANQALSQLSYGPFSRAAETAAANTWWAWIDSNYRPHPYQGCALTT
jgi:hypothetical protein